MPIVPSTKPPKDRETGALCDICKKINLELRSNRAPATYSLGTSGRIKASTDCPFCRLVYRATTDGRRGGEDEVTTEWNERGFTTSLGGVNVAFLDNGTATTARGGARAIEPLIAPALMRKWLQLCETHHAETCSPVLVLRTPNNTSGLELLRVIDVQDHCIVEATPDTRYIALSYVWGAVIPEVRLLKDSIATLSAKGGLLAVRDRLPRTIIDAIYLVGVLGERYLWIDTLCLVQDDEEDMMSGIAKMDLVYKGAILTIVASHGIDVNAGLPGLTPGSRKIDQDIEEVAPSVRMTITRGVYDSLSGSRHASRGWTMQELLLSHRTLIFVHNGVHFRCHANCWSEDTLYDNFPTEVIPTQSLHSGSLIDVLPDKLAEPLHEYGNVLFRYTYRDLTKETDRIRAATGLLRHIFRQIDGSSAVEGIPSAAFDIGLLSWDPFPKYPSAKRGRRIDFPSWSWAGWYRARVPLGYHRDELTYAANFRDWLCQNTYITWYAINPTTTATKPIWDDELQCRLGENVYGRKRDSNLAEFPTVPSAAIPKEFIMRGYHFLDFWAYTVKYPGLTLKQHQSSDFRILGNGAHDCGGIRLDDPTSFPDMEPPFEMILLSTANRFNNLFNDDVVVEKPIYFVMLIQWLDPDMTIGERRAFLHNEELYDFGEEEWATITQDISHNVLVIRIQQLMSRLVSYFKYTSRKVRALRQRLVAVTVTQEDNSDKQWNLQAVPDIVVTGAGWAYRPRNKSEEIDLKSWEGNSLQIASAVMVRKDEKLETIEDRMKLEAAFYAQEIFRAQGNRLFCFVLLVTEERCKLFYYDHGGCLETPAASIHANPTLLAWYLLLLSSPNNEVLGFDKTIRWNSKLNVRTLVTDNENREDVQYRLLDPEPIFRPRKIRGRATTCWEVEGKDGERKLVKDAWRKDASTIAPEWTMLQVTKGIEGVGEMIAYEQDWSLDMLRHPFIHPDFENRIRVRTTMKAYGKSLDFFDSREQLLYAFRDAVAGHRNLWDAGILHRDVSVNNILLGTPNAPPGQRGIIIDLDNAIQLGAEVALPRASKRVGTPPFMSTNVLVFSFKKTKPNPPRLDCHSHLDELWSFFYVLCWVCFSAPGPQREKYEKILDMWGENDKMALRAKHAFLLGVKLGNPKVPPSFGPIFDTLISCLYAYLADIDETFRKTLLALAGGTQVVFKGDVDKYAQKHYEGYLEIIDEAIGAVENEGQGEMVVSLLGDITLNVTLRRKKKARVQEKDKAKKAELQREEKDECNEEDEPKTRGKVSIRTTNL
ncbi:hypothetical protein NLJ89_g6081 [Agrocybe chaxingu]|uniref:Protein kinase domain-containing protein n=1 Tax=Agrocybe chaxingu TaxID=84603 RepID=A0A9W8MUZ6_9AGAR|nr:hypothetical protein NLJ89_g6081 [Agrocybe chaxingu]